jgi:conjugative relaxase-like TrwC/TraI family protein
MLSIGLVASSGAAATYFLGVGRGCRADYFVRPDERAGRWLGGGADALGLSGGLDGRGDESFRRLLDGRAPTGERLVEPVMRADPRSMVPASPLVKAVRAAADVAGVPVQFLLDDRRLVDRFTSLVRLVGRGRGVRVDLATRLAEPTGRDLHSIYSRSGSGRSRLVDRALAHAGRKVDTRRAGYDLTFSAPKSVSLLAAFGDDSVAATVAQAHAAAVADAMGWLERTTATAARGHHGDGRRAERVATEGFVAAAFDHGTSRAGDPQVHTHVVVANLLQGLDGRWSAVDSRALFRHGRTAGLLYQAALRAELVERLGVEWQPVRRGSAELVGVPRGVRKAFSKRSDQVRTALKAAGATGSKAAQAACLDTRPDKERLPAQDLRARWTGELRELGLAPDELVRGALHRTPASGVPDTLVEELLGPEGLTKHSTAFGRDDVLQAIASALPSGADIATIERIADDLVAREEVVAVQPRDDGSAWSPRWTTADLLAAEQRALAIAEHLRQRAVAGSPTELIERAIESAGLGEDQAAMVRALTTHRGGIAVVVGPAGSGKTAALAAANEVWSADGRDVVGVALSAMAARQLTRGSGIGACTIAQALRRIERPPSRRPPLLTAGGVLVLDEAGMVGTRDLDRLLRHVADVGATAVLVGDPAQLPEIEAGGVFAELVARDAIHLSSNRRQEAAWERAALAELRDGSPGRALDAYVAHGRVSVAADHESLNTLVVTDFIDARASGADVAILAATRAQVRVLNEQVRRHLVAIGELSGPELIVARDDGDIAVRAGDQVVVTANDYGRGLLNGTQATVAGVDVRLGTATIVTVEGGVHGFDRAQLADGLLEHAYALTCHKAQGQTLDRALVVGSSALTRETAYVALSRGREENRLYLAPDAASGVDGPEWLLDAVTESTDRQFRRSARHLLASRQLAADEAHTSSHRPAPAAATRVPVR